MARPFHDDRAGPPAPASRFLDQKAPARLRWLWPERLPLGCLTLLIGDPGVGKSLLTADLAARLSVPLPWPDDPVAERPDPATLPPLPTDLAKLTDEDVYRSFPPIRGFLNHEIAPSGVVFAAPEDHATLPDRLAAAGAAPLRVSILDGVRPPFTQDVLPLGLPGHADQLEEAIREHDHPRLVVLDPIHMLLDPGVYCSPDLQTGLVGRLNSMARTRGVTILAVGHLTKTYARRVLHRIRGPLSFVAAARSILLLTNDPNRPDRRILTQIKNTNGPLAFRIALAPSQISDLKPPGVPDAAPATATPSVPAPATPSAPAPATPSAPHLAWDDPARPDWRLATGDLDLSPESFSVLSDTCDWLTDFLSAGSRPAGEVLAAARNAGISRVTLLRAKRLLNVESRKDGVAWIWLPADT